MVISIPSDGEYPNRLDSRHNHGHSRISKGFSARKVSVPRFGARTLRESAKENEDKATVTRRTVPRQTGEIAEGEHSSGAIAWQPRYATRASVKSQFTVQRTTAAVPQEQQERRADPQHKTDTGDNLQEHTSDKHTAKPIPNRGGAWVAASARGESSCEKSERCHLRDRAGC